MISLLETILKYAPPMRMGVSRQMKEYLERLKKEREEVFGKKSDQIKDYNVNPLKQFGQKGEQKNA
jgi:hypothetical protein